MSQPPSWQWASKGGGTGWDKSYYVTTDMWGNVYVTGYIEGTSPWGQDTLISHGQYDAFLAKFDSTGNLLWARSGGGGGDDGGSSIAPDRYGNCYWSGGYRDTAIFNNDTLIATGAINSFLARYDASGNLVWMKPLGNSSYGGGIATDSAGNLYVSGRFSGTALFDTISLTTTSGSDIFLARYDSTGAVQWVRQGGNPFSNDQCYGMTTDAAGNSFLVGDFVNTATFGSHSITSAGPYSNPFIVKYDNTGQALWANRAGCSNFIFGYSIATEPSGNCFIAGVFRDTAYFDSHVLLASTPNTFEAFIAKYDTAGTALWVNKGRSTSTIESRSVTADVTGCSYISGQFAGTATFGTFNISSTFSGLDAYVAKFDTGGNVLWVQKGGSNASESDAVLTSDAAGSIYVTGQYTGTGSMFGTHAIPNSGASDVFLAKLASTLPTATEELHANSAMQLTVSPNPAGDWITITGPFEKIEFFNVVGEKMSEIKCPTENCLPVSITSLSPGLYFIKATGKTTTATGKFIRR